MDQCNQPLKTEISQTTTLPTLPNFWDDEKEDIAAMLVGMVTVSGLSFCLGENDVALIGIQPLKLHSKRRVLVYEKTTFLTSKTKIDEYIRMSRSSVYLPGKPYKQFFLSYAYKHFFWSLRLFPK